MSTYRVYQKVKDKDTKDSRFYAEKPPAGPLSAVIADCLSDQAKTTTLPVNSEQRKDYPIFAGVVRYFPAALAEVAKLSKVGNDKHNPGEPLHHARGKSMDHADCIMRHLIDAEENPVAPDGIVEYAAVAWRALALCQEWLEENRGAPLAPGAKHDR